MIDLDRYRELVKEIAATVKSTMRDPQRAQTVDFRLHQVSNRLSSLGGKSTRVLRSIHWIGSAWKWVAGSPDAADWNRILSSENEIIENNNHQYKINGKLFSKMEAVLLKVNRIIDEFKNHIDPANTDRLELGLLDQISIISEEVGEIVRACQLAKSRIINTNIVDREEINRILAEMETLPYENEIEAIEHGTPSIYVNGSMLLYIVSMPKLGRRDYNLLHTRASILDGKRIDIEYKKMLVNQDEACGITGSCSSTNNFTVCEMSDLEGLEDDDCVPKLLKCRYRTGNQTILELVKEGTIFVTNYVGELRSDGTTRQLNGTYVILFYNKTIELDDKIFSNVLASRLQVLPPVLSKVISQGNRVDIDYLHELSITNIKRLKQLTQGVQAGGILSFFILVLLIMAIGYLWKKVNGRVTLPDVGPRTLGTDPPNIC
ncbi:uncharacterized protein LOC131805666 [Musca domestica]|uniref:Uncharacterized protein LOC131805666 n=1 Tax=Musca domestica TaxID=7370 RepID=A0ABM3VH83_MUSDO|nr:uncharacterized protein LOC131805666 [Musca domestica]